MTYTADEASAILDWVRERIYPYVLREAGPRPVPVERLVELLIRQSDRAAYLVTIAPPLCPSCGCLREHQPCNADDAITGCLDKFHQLPAPSVTRYDIVTGQMTPQDEGDYVRFDDYTAALRAATRGQ